MKIAAGATMLGLGGLGGYALANNQAVTEATPASATAQGKPKVHTQVVHRTIHVRPHGATSDASVRTSPAAASGSPQTPAASSAPAPVPAPAASPSAPATEPVSTHTSGTAASGASSSYDDGGGGAEHESEGDDD
jgi:hypothetical protein